MSPQRSGRGTAGGPPVALAETCRVVAGRIPLWSYHKARLSAGGCAGGVLAEAEERALSAAAEWTGSSSARVRLSLTVSPAGDVAVGVSQRLSSLDVVGGPRALRIEVEGEPPLPDGAAKPADRSWWDNAQWWARAGGADQAIITDKHGQVLDGGTASVWVVEGTQIVTPPAPPAIAGVARAFLLDAASDNGIRAFVEPVSWSRIDTADELFLTNALAGAVAVRGRGGLVFAAVAAVFEGLWRSAS